jgi:hypothetical protein
MISYGVILRNFLNVRFKFLPGKDKTHAKVLCYICNGVAELYEVKARTRAGRLVSLSQY